MKSFVSTDKYVHQPSTRSGGEGKNGELPSWDDLRPAQNRRKPASAQDGKTGIAALPTAHMLVLLTAVFGLLTLYVGHVHATKQLLAEVQELRKENLQLRLTRNQLSGEVNRVVGPKAVHRRARELGYIEGESYGAPIMMDGDLHATN